MPYNGSGTFSLTYNWATEQASSPIEIAKLDTQESDIAAGLSNCILRDGTGLPSTTIPWNSQALTGVSNLSAERVTVTGSTVPVNGMYLSAANTVAFSTNTTVRAVLDSATFGVGSAASVSNAGKAGTDRMIEVSSTTNGDIVGVQAFVNDGVNGRRAQLWVDDTAGTFGLTGTASSGVPDFKLEIGGLTPLSVTSGGNVTIAAPSSGTALTVSAASGGTAITASESAVPKIGLTSSGGERAFFQYTEATSTARIDSDAILELASNNTARISIASAGNVTINAPSSGTPLTVAGAGGSATTQAWTGGSTVALAQGTTSGHSGIGTSTAHDFSLFSNNANRITIGTAGNVTINAASSGTELTVTGEVAATTFVGALTGDVTGNVSGSSGSCTGNAATATALQTARTINGTSFNGTANITVTAAADTLTGTTLAALSGANLTALNATQLTSGTVPSARITSVDASATINSFTIGYRQIPLSATTSGSLPTSDVGKMVAATAGVTIPNSTFSAGDAVSIVNDSASSITITASITTLYWTQTGGTGNRTLAARGSCTVWFKSGTVAYISGAGLS